MSISFVAYETNTGKVTLTGTSSPSMLPKTENLETGTTLYRGLLGGSRETRYMPSGVPTDRPTMSLATAGLIITGVPNGTSVTVSYRGSAVMTETITDGEVDLTGSTAGTYTLSLENFPYQDKTLEITV